MLATQTLLQARPKTMLVRFAGELPFGLTAKDMVLGAIGRIGVAGGVGYAIEYAGPAIEALSMEGRMTICNMSIEAGARAGMIAPDETTFAYLEGRPAAPGGAGVGAGARALARAPSDPGAAFDRAVEIDVTALDAAGHVGHEPRHGRARSTASFPTRPTTPTLTSARRSSARSRYMALEPGTPIVEIRIDRVFIGSCTNARIEDLRAAAAVADGRRVASSVRAIVVPGSAQVEAPGRGRKGSTASSSAPGSSGARRAARCAWDEPGHPRAGRALRVDLEPQLRGPPGHGRSHASAQPRDGRRRRDRRALHRRTGARVRALPRAYEGAPPSLDRPDVDTDQIIPKQFLKRIERAGYGEFLDLWAYNGFDAGPSTRAPSNTKPTK